MKAIQASILDGSIHAELALVVSDKTSCGGVEYAAAHGIPTVTFPRNKSGAGIDTATLLASMEERRVDFVVLAGYLKLIPAELVRAFPRRILNIHPGLLPSFGGKGLYGARVHQAVLASGARFSGPTVHFVDEEYDTGPILAQRVVPVLPFDTPDTLAARVLREEHVVYPRAVSALCDGRITWREDGIPVMWEAL